MKQNKEKEARKAKERETKEGLGTNFTGTFFVRSSDVILSLHSRRKRLYSMPYNNMISHPLLFF
jgi:hypothetical protein